MRILVFGLPGSGKTTLTKKLVGAFPIHMAEHLNADTVRKTYNDWDFSPEGRMRQAKRMRELSDTILSTKLTTYAIADFVAPTKELRSVYAPDFSIWMDTIAEGRFEDTNKAWQVPTEDEYNVRITDYNYSEERLCNLIIKHQQG